MKFFWHVILGVALAGIMFFIFPNIPVIYLLILFISSFIIDADSLIDNYLKKRHKTKDKDFHLFHTLEFHLIIGAFSLLWIGFFYIFIGMVFHSLTDVFEMLIKGNINRREFFLTKLLYNYSR